MKVLILMPRLDSHSGWGRYSSSILSEFQKRGIDVRVAAPEQGQFLTLEPFSALGFLKNILALRKAAKACEIVHALDGWPYALYGYGAVCGTNKKLFINAVGTYALPGRSLLKKFLLGLVYQRAQMIFAISRYTKKRVASVFGKEGKIEVVHLGTTPLPAASRTERFEAFTHPIFITVGAIKNRKGQKDTVKALALLKEEYPDFTYLLVGSSEDVAYVEGIKEIVAEKGIEKNLKILANVESDGELAYLYSISDVIILNSRNDHGHFEGFGLVFLEAYQFGVPGVGSRDTGIEDAIEEGETGFLSNQADPKDIAEKIRKTLMQKERLGVQAKEFTQKFSWEKTVEAYLNAYQNKKD